MKTCQVCGETYSERVDFCFNDGEVLVLLPSAMDAPMPRLAAASATKTGGPLVRPAPPDVGADPEDAPVRAPMPGQAADAPAPPSLPSEDEALDAPPLRGAPPEPSLNSTVTPPARPSPMPAPEPEAPEEEEDDGVTAVVPAAAPVIASTSSSPRVGDATPPIRPKAVVPPPESGNSQLGIGILVAAVVGVVVLALGTMVSGGDEVPDKPATVATPTPVVPATPRGTPATPTPPVATATPEAATDTPEPVEATPDEIPEAGQPEATPEPTPEAALASVTPTPAAEVTPEATPTPAPSPEGTREPATEPTPVAVVPEETPEPTAEPTATPEPATPTPATPTPTPTPAPATPTPAPATPTPDAVVDAATPTPAADNPWDAPSEPTVGAATFTTDPAGALISVDGAPRGRTPVNVNLQYGRHDVRVSLEGYRELAKSVDVQSAEPKFPFALERLVREGNVLVAFEGWDQATLYVDGKLKGQLPANVKLTEGMHTFVVVGERGEVKLRRTVTLAESGLTRLLLHQ